MKKSIPRDVSEVVDVHQLQRADSLFGIPPAVLAAASAILRRIDRFTGLESTIRIPDAFSGYAPEAWKALVTLEKLKRMDWVKDYFHIHRRYPDEPALKQFVAVTAIPNTSGFNGSGADFFSMEKALWAAVGETIERRAMFFFEPNVWKDAPYISLHGQAVDLSTLAGVSPERRLHDTRFKFDSTSVFRWVWGRSLVQKKKIAVPLQLVSFKKHLALQEGREPILRHLVTTGAAAHTEPSAAMVSGTLELIERDAFMVMWMNRLSPERIRLESIPNPRIQKVLRSFAQANLTIDILYLPTDFPIHVVLVSVRDSTGIGPAMNVGGASGFELSETIEKALSEAASCRMYIRSFFRETTSPQEGPVGRRGRLVYWAQAENAPQADFLFQGPLRSYESLPQCPTFSSPAGKLAHIVGLFKEKKLELVSVPLLSRELENELAFFAYVMVAPELQPLHLDESLPYDWGERLESVPKKLGLTALGKKNTLPHPFP